MLFHDVVETLFYASRFAGILHYTAGVCDRCLWFFQTCLSLGYIFLGSVSQLIGYTGSLGWAFQGLVGLGVIIYRFTHKDTHRPYRVTTTSLYFLVDTGRTLLSFHVVSLLHSRCMAHTSGYDLHKDNCINPTTKEVTILRTLWSRAWQMGTLFCCRVYNQLHNEV